MRTIQRKPPSDREGGVFIKQNHWLGQWFKKAYGDEEERKTPFVIIDVRSANCTKIAKGGHSKWA